MAKKVIDPQPIIDKLAARCLESKGLECSVLGSVIDMLKAAPSVDATEVVYCKDCARYKKGYCTIRKDSWGATLLVGKHDFCSDAERKDNV